MLPSKLDKQLIYEKDYKAVPCIVHQACEGCMFHRDDRLHSSIGVCTQPKDKTAPLCCDYELYPDGLIFVPVEQLKLA